MQTDPNFANFRYRVENDEVVLLDFGATRRFSPELVDSFRMLVEAILGGSEDAVEQAAEAVGYLAPEDTPAYRRAVVDMVSMAAEPARFSGAYDFAAADLSERMSEHVMRMHTEQGFGRLPPPDLLYIHRKFAGLYLLLKRLRAKVPLSELIAPYLTRRQ